jgi:uncharacterized protein (TIGR02996 family)
MTEDEPFLRALLANPDDNVARLVYADWLDERSDPRAEYVRITARLGEPYIADKTRAELRKRLDGLQTAFPAWWVAIVGGLRVIAADETFHRARAGFVAQALGLPATRTDADGYEISVCSGALSGLTGAVGYLESRSKWLDNYHDISYRLRLRDTTGREVSWEPYTYNPFFGCDTQFLEWYGDAGIFIYKEKHDVYICRFGFDERPTFQAIKREWVLDGRAIGYRGWREKTVRRLSIPALEPLPPLSEMEAARCGLLPAARWE